MKKKALRLLLLTGLLAAALGASTVVSADQEEVNWNVTFTAAGAMDESFNSDEINQALSEMQPGDTAVFTVAIKNENSNTTDWYMENEVLSTLEEASAASNGAYTYVLDYVNDQTNISRNLFDSDRVGGEDIAAAEDGNEGLKEATTGLDEWFYLDELGSNDGGHVTLKVSLEGESQGNDYQDTRARLRIRFAVELRETTVTPTPTPSTSPTPTPTSPSTGTGTVVRTGDPTQNLPYIIAATVAGILLLILAVVGTKQRRKAEEGVSDSGRKGGRNA